jgi:catechol 2,3-dioxygenase-like lactoylglutathione lyase family enzyme
MNIRPPGCDRAAEDKGEGEMTQIRGFIGATRRPGQLGVHSLDEFTLVVPDMKLAETFYGEFGLELEARGNRIDVHTNGHSHRWGTIVEGPRKRLSHLSFGVFEDDFPRFKERLNILHVHLLDAPPGLESNGLWFHSPDGLLMELRVADKSSPNDKSSFMMASAPVGTQCSPNRSQAPRTKPRRLAHVLIFTADVIASIAFYERVLGLRLSDRSNDGIAFMHGIHGSDHHLLALAKAQGPGLHHLSWDVGSINDIGLGAMHMADKGYAAGWGLGRHVLGSNYFHYIRDPWGSYSEYSADIDYIPVNCDWHGRDNPAHDSFYLWGPTPPKDFAANHEVGS